MIDLLRNVLHLSCPATRKLQLRDDSLRHPRSGSAQVGQVCPGKLCTANAVCPDIFKPNDTVPTPYDHTPNSNPKIRNSLAIPLLVFLSPSKSTVTHNNSPNNAVPTATMTAIPILLPVKCELVAPLRLTVAKTRLNPISDELTQFELLTSLTRDMSSVNVMSTHYCTFLLAPFHHQHHHSLEKTWLLTLNKAAPCFAASTTCIVALSPGCTEIFAGKGTCGRQTLLYGYSLLVGPTTSKTGTTG